MISIVTAYFNRKKLFLNTLQSIKKQNFDGEFEVIAVDDGSDEIERLEDLVPEFPFLRVIRLEKENKWYKNSCIPFNIGFKEAKGDKIIIQNPECLHLDDILKYTEDHLTKNNFISFSCFSLDKANTEGLDYNVDKDIIKTLINNNNFVVKMDGELGWYNHSLFRPVFYHFCCCITKNDLYDLGGFDERYALGIGVDDDEFIYRIKQKGMLMKIEDNLCVLHQNHYTHVKSNKVMNAEKSERYQRNQNLFNNVTKINNTWRVNFLGEHFSRNNEDKIIDDYRNVLYDKVSDILPHRFSRKLALVILNQVRKIKF